MGELVIASSSVGLPRVLPSPRVPIRIRPGTMDDIPFIDSLQKLHTRQVGWMPTATFAGKIKLGHVLVAWASRPCSAEDMGETAIPPQERVGYLIGNDQYFKRDDVGIIYQLNVSPGVQRGLIGAALLKAQFARSAYGCRLYCCWCAQDIAANHFWEAMGFVPLAFRAGSRTKGKDASGKSAPRVHIFSLKRICSGDTGDVKRGGTPWWFPSKTTGGAIREDRIVLPIPPGTHWSDAKPLLLPGMPQLTEAATPNRRALPGPRPKRLIIPAERLRLASNGGLRSRGMLRPKKPARRDRQQPK